jgi:hypothetical protein
MTLVSKPAPPLRVHLLLFPALHLLHFKSLPYPRSRSLLVSLDLVITGLALRIIIFLLFLLDLLHSDQYHIHFQAVHDIDPLLIINNWNPFNACNTDNNTSTHRFLYCGFRSVRRCETEDERRKFTIWRHPISLFHSTRPNGTANQHGFYQNGQNPLYDHFFLLMGDNANVLRWLPLYWLLQ